MNKFNKIRHSSLNYKKITSFTLAGFINVSYVKFSDGSFGFLNNEGEILKLNGQKIVEFDSHTFGTKEGEPLYQVRLEDNSWTFVDKNFENYNVGKGIHLEDDIENKELIEKYDLIKTIKIKSRKGFMKISEVFGINGNELFVRFENGFCDFINLKSVEKIHDIEKANNKNRKRLYKNLK